MKAVNRSLAKHLCQRQLTVLGDEAKDTCISTWCLAHEPSRLPMWRVVHVGARNSTRRWRAHGAAYFLFHAGDATA